MKKTKSLTASGEQILILLAALLIALAVVVRAEAYPTYGMPGDRPDYEPEWAYEWDDEYADLDGYGEWRFVSGAGARLWFPFVEVSWRPYMHGHWIHTDFGMTWVAYEPWGHVPHHYGRWIWIDRYGWGWVPGREYGPAWVTWGVADGHIGWAPLAPVRYRYPHRYSYRVRHHPVRYGYAGFFGYDVSGIAFNLWVFVPERHFYGVNVSVHALPEERCVEFFRTERVLPVGHRIHVDYVRKKTPRRIDTVKIDRVIETRGGARYERRVPRGQEKMVGEARPAMERVVKRRGGVDPAKSAPAAAAPRTVARKGDEGKGTRTVTRSSESRPGGGVGAVQKPSGPREDSRYEKSVPPPARTKGPERRTPERKETVERKREAKKDTPGRTAGDGTRKVSGRKYRSGGEEGKKSDREEPRSSKSRERSKSPKRR